MPTIPSENLKVAVSLDCQGANGCSRGPSNNLLKID